MLFIEEDFARYPNTGRFLAGRLRAALGEGEKQRLESMVERTEWIERPTRLIARGEHCQHSTILVDGFMLRTIDDEDARFVVSFHVPGDFVDLHCYPMGRLDHNIDTLGAVKVAYVPHKAIDAVLEEDLKLARALWFSTLLDAAMHREWIMKLEQLTAPKRLGHIFAEIARRLQMVGLGGTNGFDTPLTQSDLAAMCGATAIHTNRALRDLREANLAHFQRGAVRIPDLAALERYSHFTPDYLYGPGELAPDR
ncbi:Crp/Fnr family transcriptional regulator [Qipengyuania sediminis]|uniref:Crp/Fnr family transcriptional regulator n=1 Tax=Qipengyuania sediminis TaxID=1532023 RepID=UPI00105AA512|nr:Crp/Fnr family transcriptional regulator [Qipengyuania sediminis]